MRAWVQLGYDQPDCAEADEEMHKIRASENGRAPSFVILDALGKGAGMVVADHEPTCSREGLRRLTSDSFDEILSRVASSTARMLRRPSQFIPIATSTA